MNRHANPKKSDRTSKAPYNFIPLPDKVFPAPAAEEQQPPWQRFDEYISGAHTGWIDLKIKAETPLYVRCGPNVKDIQKHEASQEDQAELTRKHRHRQDFFHHGDPGCPVIPGSSIRGMIRSLVEILSFGKMQWFTNKQLIYRAVGDASSLGQQYRDKMLGPNKEALPNMLFEYPIQQLRGGYLERNGLDWAIRPACEFLGESIVHVDYKTADWTNERSGRAYNNKDIIPVFLKPVSRTRPKRSKPNLKLNFAYIDSSAHIKKQSRKHC